LLGFGSEIKKKHPGATVRPIGVEYRALGVVHNPLRPFTSANVSYLGSIWQGVDRLVALMKSEADRCETGTKFVLSGYSQGALVVHLALLQLEDEESPLLSPSRIAGVILVADPAKTQGGDGTLYIDRFSRAADSDLGMLNATGVWSQGRVGRDDDPIPSTIWSRTVSMCHNNDMVCAPGWGSTSGNHTDYSNDEGRFMGGWVAARENE
jgi:hypothetical protein